LETVIPGSKKVILEPSGEDLRSNDFIKAVSTLCVQRNLPVELRGSILSHAFHQLAKDGVQVYSAEPGKRPVEMRQRKAFDKLVRDQIPENIKAKGETVSADELAPEDLAMALIGKLFEEAEEFLSADTINNRLEELADLLEIIRALADVSKVASFSDVIMRADSKRSRRGGFEKGTILRSTSVIANAPQVPGLFEEGAGRRRINLTSLRESQTGMRSQTPIITLLSQGPRMLSLGVPGYRDVSLKIYVAGGAVFVELLEINDSRDDGQQKLL
jgi:predicted house-cleaning noncanonical NTP pyrophosphatase (MazG superfamily)